MKLALNLAAITLVARVVGFGRWLVFSKTVGDTCLGDAYNAANSLPNVLFEVVAGGVLAGVVVPVVARHAAAGRGEDASRTVSALLSWTLLVLTVPTLAALVGAQLYAEALAKPSCPGSAATVAALLVMFVPQVWLYGLAVVSAGVLQAHGRFLAAACAPLLSSVVVVAAYVGFAASGRSALAVLGWGTTAGVAALALTTAVPLGRLGLRLRPKLGFAAGDRRAVATIAAAGVAGLVLQQASVLVINYVAQRSGGPGALTRYTWANAVYLLPYAVLAAPLLQLAFPRLAAAAERGQAEVAGVLREVLPLVLVAACGGAALLVVTAVPVARVFVLGPGSGDTLALAAPIAVLGPAVVGFSVLGLTSRTLLAQHRARAAGIATATAWSVVIVAAPALSTVLGGSATVLAGSVSLGMLVGAGVGIGFVRPLPGVHWGADLLRPTAVGVAGVLLAAGLLGGPAWALRDSSLLVAGAGAVGLAAAAALLFLGVLRLGDRSHYEAVRALVGRSARDVRVGAE